MMIKTLFAVAAACSATFVSAQLSISSQCETALETVVASPQASCLDGSALVSLVLQGNSSIIGPINQWLTGLCALPPCSNATLAAVATNLTNGCAAELTSLGLTSSDASPSTVTPILQAAYPAFRQVFCLKDTSNNTLCVPETLTNIQGLVGTLSIDNIGNVITNLMGITSVPASVICTDCVKEAYNVFEKDYPSEVSSATGFLQSQCGESFTNGSAPADVAEIAAAGTASGAALTLLSRGAFTGIAISMLLVVSSAVAFLA